MKRCGQCGAEQSDGRMFCVDCGARLGEPLPEEESRRAAASLSEKIGRATRAGDDLAPGRAERAVGIALFAIAAVCVVIWQIPVFPPDVRKLVFAAFFAAAAAGMNAAFPQLMWGLEKLRLSLTVRDSETAEPSWWWTVCRRALIWGGAAAVLILIALAAWGCVRAGA